MRTQLYVLGACLLVVVGIVSVDLYINGKIADYQTESDVLQGRINQIVETAEDYRAKAEEAGRKTHEALQAVEKKDKENARLKSDLKSLLANYKPDPVPDDKDQIISKQGELIDGLNSEIDSLKTANETLSQEALGWKNTADQYKEAFTLSEQRVRSEQLAKEAMKAAGPIREVKGMVEGGAVVFLAHVLGVF